MGGAETAVIYLLEALASRGHEVEARTKIESSEVCNGVHWRPLGETGVRTPDLYIANRGSRMIDAMPQARRTVFLIHNPAGYLKKWRFLWRLWKVRPAIVFSGPYHASTFPSWAPSGNKVVIPYGIAEEFRAAQERPSVPGPRAIFTSNPKRGLDWLLDRWTEEIEPAVPGAELYLFSGSATYAGRGGEGMDAVLSRARGLRGAGVILKEPVRKAELVREICDARVMLYRGDEGESYCLAVAEAQALGTPAVVQPIGALAERVIDGETGFVTHGDAEFSARAIGLLTDDALWKRQHRAALAKQRAWTWDHAAAEFEKLI